MMGKDNADNTITLKIGENVEYMNEEFEGEILFELNELFIEPNGAYLPDLYTDFHQRSQTFINSLVHPIEKQGSVNIYLFDTYSEENSDAALMGFTPRLRANESAYANNSPRFDRIFIAYQGLEDMTTLTHEMGHFLGLKHPWELSHAEQHNLGLRDKHVVEVNHMAYGESVSSFTKQQLEKMRKHALKYRQYLMRKIITDFKRA